LAVDVHRWRRAEDGWAHGDEGAALSNGICASTKEQSLFLRRNRRAPGQTRRRRAALYRGRDTVSCRPPRLGKSDTGVHDSLEADMTSWRKSTADEVYSTDDITARLADELPKWYLEDGWIRRKFKTSGWKGTLMVVNTVGHLAEAAWHHPDLTVSYAFVTVKLMNHAAKGITDKDFELAKKIEEVVMWQPGAASALEGTPDDPRFKYLKYD
jgi:4a-hydroxytetrahydrobiopterin dehydratase